MRKLFITLLLVITSMGCTHNMPVQPPSAAPTSSVNETLLTENDAVWAIYDSDPDHIWNQVFRHLYRRMSIDEREYGSEELDPLLWFDTTYLLDGVSHQQAVDVLDEFQDTHAEDLIQDPLKRAMFQRDMWAVFDWAASQPEPYRAERQTLMTKLAQVIKRVALSKAEIQSLPDHYAMAIGSGIFPDHFEMDQPEKAFLPIDLFRADGAWVPLGRDGGPAAISHISSLPFLGHSVFLVFIRSSEGRAATLDLIDSLNNSPNPVLAIGSDVALVRKMLLIDQEGNLQLSPIVETIQLRHFRPEQSFYEFELDRAHLFNGIDGGLVLNTDIFLLFMSHGDVFENYKTEQRAVIPEICKACHFEPSTAPASVNTNTIISYSRNPFALPDGKRPTLFATTMLQEVKTVVQWKLGHETWKSLKFLWDGEHP